MRVIGVLQARTSSRRLPGKVLADILGRPMILRQIQNDSEQLSEHKKLFFIEAGIISRIAMVRLVRATRKPMNRVHTI